nr:hypothetical protein CFP56_61486 [Quercus suber]
MSGALLEYHAFLVSLGFGHFLSIPFIALRHSLVRAWYERFFLKTGTFSIYALVRCPHASQLECYPWHPIGGRPIPTDPITIEEVVALKGSLKLDKPSSEAIRRQFLLYFLRAYILGDNKTFIPLHLVSSVRDISILKDIDWGSSTFSYYNWGLRQNASWSTSNFTSFWQFIVYWVTIRTSSEYCTEIDCLQDKDIEILSYDEELMGISIVERAITLTRLRESAWRYYPRSFSVWARLLTELAKVQANLRDTQAKLAQVEAQLLERDAYWQTELKSRIAHL